MTSMSIESTSPSIISDSNYIYMMGISSHDCPFSMQFTDVSMVFNKIDFNGNIVVQKSLYKVGKTYIPQYGISFSPNKKYIYVVGGYADSIVYKSSGFVVKYNLDGDTVWTKKFDGYSVKNWDSFRMYCITKW